MKATVTKKNEEKLRIFLAAQTKINDVKANNKKVQNTGGKS